jgi:hypothetical protein
MVRPVLSRRARPGGLVALGPSAMPIHIGHGQQSCGPCGASMRVRIQPRVAQLARLFWRAGRGSGRVARATAGRPVTCADAGLLTMSDAMVREGYVDKSPSRVVPKIPHCGCKRGGMTSSTPSVLSDISWRALLSQHGLPARRRRPRARAWCQLCRRMVTGRMVWHRRHLATPTTNTQQASSRQCDRADRSQCRARPGRPGGLCRSGNANLDRRWSQTMRDLSGTHGCDRKVGPKWRMTVEAVV